jgi:acetyl esterase
MRGPGGRPDAAGSARGGGSAVAVASIAFKYRRCSLPRVVPDLPRLPIPLEHRLMRRICGLPPRTLRRIFGPPPRLDGQVLAPDVHAIVSMARRAGEASLTGGLPPDQARARVRRSAAVGACPPLPMAELLHFELPGPAGPLKARLYVPHTAPPPPRPMIVHYHGGGWVVGDLDTNDSACRFLAAHSGATIFSPTYRLAPEHPFPAAVEDAQAAYHWARSLAPELGADPGRIAVGGDSAGGNLAAGVCVAMRDGGGPAPAMQLLIYPATEAIEPRRSRTLFPEGFMLTQLDIDYCERAYLPDKSLGYEGLASILRIPDLSELPPAYVATAGFDPLRDEGEEYAARMREAGVKVAQRRHRGLTHLFANSTSISPSCRSAMLEAAGALRMGLAAAPSAYA